MNPRSLFNRAVLAGLLATTALAGCQELLTPEEQAGVHVDEKRCIVTDKKPQGYGNANAYDFKNAALHFNSSTNWPTTMAMKDLGEDGQARAMEMFKYLPPTANCKPPKF